MNLQNPKFTLLAIALLFAIPVLIAIAMQSKTWNFEPPGGANRGTLVEPPLRFPLERLELQYSGSEIALSKQRKWVLLYPFEIDCDQSCLEVVASLRQVHLATGRKRQQVAIWLLSPERTSDETQAKLLAVYSELEILNDPYADASSVLESVIPEPFAGQTFLLDPVTNIILSYKPGFDPNDIARDLDRLLTWSRAN